MLQLAVPLVKTHGFTRAALARAVLDLPHPHSEPLPDGGVTALFGPGDDARRTLVNAWLEDARCRMRQDHHAGTTSSMSMRDVLYARLRMNEPVLVHLPEVRSPSSPIFFRAVFFFQPLLYQALALLATSSSVLPLDPSPVLAHAARVADQACWIAEPHVKEVRRGLTCCSLVHSHA